MPDLVAGGGVDRRGAGQDAKWARLLTRIAFGFKNPDALIALAMLALGGLCPSLPARSATS